MYKVCVVVIFCLIPSKVLWAQKNDSVFLQLTLDTLRGEIKVQQEFRLYNATEKTFDTLQLHAWANAYSGKATVLNRTKLEERKGKLHFSNKEERGGISDLTFLNAQHQPLSFVSHKREFLQLILEAPWQANQFLQFYAHYKVKIPTDQITVYGRNQIGNYLLKYFFLEMAIWDPYKGWEMQHFKDMEAVTSAPKTYVVQINIPTSYSITGNLENENQVWIGNDLKHIELFFTKDSAHIHHFQQGHRSLDVGFELEKSQVAIMDSLLPMQWDFLEKHVGPLRHSHLFISSKIKKEQNFFGVDDLDAWVTEIPLFSEQEKTALKLMQWLTYAYLDRLLAINTIKDHWLRNGLQYYLMMKYVDEFFPETLLFGDLSQKISWMGIQPLQLFNLSKLKLNERYHLLYLYMTRQNYDQPINTPWDKMSKMNQIAMSGFKTGMTFRFIAEYLGENTFVDLVRSWLQNNQGKMLSQQDFQFFLAENSPKDLSWFFDDFIDKKDKINFKLKRIDAMENDWKVQVKNTTDFTGPFQLVGMKNDEVVEEKWYLNNGKYAIYSFPKGNYDKVVINPKHLFPEFKQGDNYLYTHGLFKNAKKIQFKLYSDIENPEYSQVFMNPKLAWNNYDKLLLGIRFHNQSLLTKPYKWYIEPKLSSGTGKLAGAVGVENSFTPRKTMFRSITLGVHSKFEHYDQDLKYLKWTVYADANFKKDPRTSLSHGVILSWDHLDKELPAFRVKTDEDQYALLNLTYYYSRPNYIHEFHGSATFQTTSVFQKIYGEAYYRWRFAPRHQMGIRLFAGVFVDNDANTDYFNFGWSKASDYAFNLNMLGRSENSGVLSQQYFLAEAGFKSIFDHTVNQWLLTSNIEITVWKLFDVYTDLGVYKNSHQKPSFLYDTGLKVNFIPDFLSLYFPMQSSLGFEPARKNYWEGIRFTLNLNLTSIINHLRRGWY